MERQTKPSLEIVKEILVRYIEVLDQLIRDPNIRKQIDKIEYENYVQGFLNKLLLKGEATIDRLKHGELTRGRLRIRGVDIKRTLEGLIPKYEIRGIPEYMRELEKEKGTAIKLKSHYDERLRTLNQLPESIETRFD